MSPNNHHMRGFFTLWGGQALSLLGSQIVQFALIWYLTESTGSATVLAFASLVGLLPTIILGPIAGTLVDRWSRRWVMFSADLLVAIATAILALLFALDLVQLWHIYAILFVRALGGAFQQPAMTASTSLMVPAKHLTRIAGMNQMLNGGLNIISAPIGALLIETLTMPAIFAIDIATAAFAILPLLFIAVPQPPAPEQPLHIKPNNIRQDLVEGFQYVWSWTGLRILITIAVVLNFLFAPASALMPLLITEHFQGGAPELAFLNASFGTGIIAGGLLLGIWGGFQRKMATTMVGLLGLALSTIVLGATPSHLFYLALVASVFSGLTQPIANGPIMATMQEVVAPEKQGRVFTLLGSFATLAMPLGLIIAGPLSDLIGIQTWFLLGGSMSIILSLWAWSNPEFRNLDQHKPQTTTAIPQKANA